MALEYFIQRAMAIFCPRKAVLGRPARIQDFWLRQGGVIAAAKYSEPQSTRGLAASGEHHDEADTASSRIR